MEKRIWKYVICPCKGGYLLSTYQSEKSGESEVFVDGMTMLTKIADLEGLLEDDAEEEKVLQ